MVRMRSKGGECRLLQACGVRKLSRPGLRTPQALGALGIVPSDIEEALEDALSL
jgi:hypothetical protein